MTAVSAAIEVGHSCAGFTVEEIREVANLRAKVYLARHDASGLRWLHVESDDRENLFAIAFRTRPLLIMGLLIFSSTPCCVDRKRTPLRIRSSSC